MMTITRSFTLLLSISTLFAIAADAQKTASKRPVKRPVTTRSGTSTLPPLEVRAARVKVSNQLSNVTQFVTLMGPAAENIEAIDDQAQSRKLSKATADLNAANKQKLLTAIRNMKAGIVALENEFKTKPDLRQYLIKIQGISELATQSENSAISGRFVSARDPWRTISQKLNDTLTAMPNAEL